MEDLKSADPMKALEAAIQADDIALVGRVLAQRPELRSRLNEAMPGEAFGATPLLRAVDKGNRELVELLLEAGADINQRSHWWAGSFGVLDHDGDLAPFLIERGAIVDAHAAARLGMLDRLRALVAADPSVVHARGGDGQTPLHFAKNVEVAEFLLEHGADIDARDIDHESTPAQWMIRDRQDVVRYLVQHGCRTELLMAAALGDLVLVRKHLEADPSSIYMTVSDQYFPRQNPRSAGTIYNWTLDSDKTAHLVARWFGHEEILAYLMAQSPDELRLSVACELGDGAQVAELLARHPGVVQHLPEEELRKLPNAARDNNIKAVRTMLAAGWQVNTRGPRHGETALHWAGFHGNSEMAAEILRHHPDLTLRSLEFDGTALDWGIYGSVHGWHPERGDYTGTVAALLDAGAKAPPANQEFQGSDAVRQVLERNRK